MSELDERRREYLAGYFLESTQAVISTTNLEYFDEEILRRTRIIRISGGSILENATDGAAR
jgi:recombinational DNA repair ATPase RecF